MKRIFDRIPVIKYANPFRVVWDVFLIIAVLVASFVFSYRIVFDTAKADAGSWALTAIFLADIAVNFLKSVKVKLETIEDRKGIAARYLRGWFAVDLIAALPLVALLDEVRAPAGSAAAILVDVLRLLWLVKLLRVNSLFRDFQEGFNTNPGLMRLVNFVFWFLQGINIMSLGWCIIGATEQARPPLDQYIRALYWCVTTIATIGYGDYYPNHEKNAEILYTILVQIIGVGMYGYIIGNVSSLIANIDVAKSEYLKKLEGIKNYMRAKRIPPSIQEKVKNYYAYLWETRKNVSTWAMFEDIPHTLKMEMSLYLNKGIIEKVSLFKNASDLFIREIVQILEPMVFLPHDFIIRQGEFGDCMYFLSTGDVEVLVGEQKVAQLGEGSPFGEAALIQGEKRNASVRALSYCDVYKLSKVNFDRLREKYPDFDAQVKKVMEERKMGAQKG
jgi:hypothetical protein